VKQFLTFTSGAPFQPAVATALGAPRPELEALATALERRRDQLCEGLDAAGFEVSVPEGTYFVLADAAPFGVQDGLDLCRRLPELAGVVAVPVRVFCDDPGPLTSVVRFAFCKRDDVIAEAVRRLKALGRP
jgi:N-succinyldiaminopimelate aminotransferase